MADYHPLIARAVAGLEKNSSETRRVVYDRARNALVAQLRAIQPPLEEGEITRERLELEEAIRKVESEEAQKTAASGASAGAVEAPRAPPAGSGSTGSAPPRRESLRPPQRPPAPAPERSQPEAPSQRGSA